MTRTQLLEKLAERVGLAKPLVHRFKRRRRPFEFLWRWRVPEVQGSAGAYGRGGIRPSSSWCSKSGFSAVRIDSAQAIVASSLSKRSAGMNTSITP